MPTRKVIAILFISLICTQCSRYEVIDGIPIRQYASSVIDFSTEYPGWEAYYTLGEEDAYPNYGDIKYFTWASATADGQREHLVLGFDIHQTVKIVEIYETYNPGAIDTVYLRNAQSQKWEVVYSKPAVELPKNSRIFKFFLPLETTYLVDAIRLAINSEAVPSWNEIDAVAITGQRKKNN